MADIAGHGGDFAIGTATVATGGEVEWSATLEVDEVAIPPAFGEKWEGAAQGAWRCRGSMRAKLQKDVSGTAPWEEGTNTDSGATVEGAITATAATGCTIKGDVIFSNIRVTRPHLGGTPEFSADFRNSGTNFAVDWDIT